MPITQAQRHHLLTQLEATIGKEAAMTLADHLPPVGWADVATKADLDHLRTEMQLLRAEFRDELHSEIGSLRSDMHAEFSRQTRHFTTALLVGMGANAAVVAGLTQLG